MSFWGSWLLTNCDQDLVINVAGHWFFPSERSAILAMAELLGVRVKGLP